MNVNDLTFDNGVWSSADLGRFRALYESSFPADERDDTDELVAGLLDGTRPHLVARHQGDLVGFVVFSYLGDTHIVFLEYMAVMPELRGKRIGTHLLTALRSHVQEQSPGTLGFVLEVDPPEDATGAEATLRARRIDFYERNGATLVTQIRRLVVPDLSGEGTVDLQLMWIALEAGSQLTGRALRDCVESLLVHGYGSEAARSLVALNLRAIGLDT